MTRIQGRPWLVWSLVALLALALTAAPLWAASDGYAVDSWTKTFRYAACAFALAGAVTGWGLLAAGAMCLSILASEVG